MRPRSSSPRIRSRRSGHTTAPAWVGAADEGVAEEEDRLADAEAVRRRVEERLVAEPVELVRAVEEARLERDAPSFLDAEARGIQGRLRIGALAQAVDELDVS